MELNVVTQQSLEALSYFKDWSNFLLITTVAALGWTAKKDVVIQSSKLRKLTMVFFSLSIVFAIFTLGLIPLVASSTDLAKGISIYEVTPSFDILWLIGEIDNIRLKHVCWWQHVFFLAGIFSFVVATWNDSNRNA